MDSTHPPRSQSKTNDAAPILEKLPMLGPVIWLYSHLPTHKHFFMADIEWLLMPALVLDQCKLYMKGKAPVAFASWAYIDETTEKRLLSGDIRLAPKDWNSGDKLVLIDLVAPFGGGEDILQDLKRQQFPKQEIHEIKNNNKTNKTEFIPVPSINPKSVIH